MIKDLKFNFTMAILLVFTVFASLVSFNLYAGTGDEANWLSIIFEQLQSFQFQGASAGAIGLLISQTILKLLKQTSILDGIVKKAKDWLIPLFNLIVSVLTIVIIGGSSWSDALGDATIWAAIQTLIYQLIKSRKED